MSPCADRRKRIFPPITSFGGSHPFSKLERRMGIERRVASCGRCERSSDAHSLKGNPYVSPLIFPLPPQGGSRTPIRENNLFPYEPFLGSHPFSKLERRMGIERRVASCGRCERSSDAHSLKGNPYVSPLIFPLLPQGGSRTPIRENNLFPYEPFLGSHPFSKLERRMGFEPTTSSLARRHSSS